MFMRKSVLLLSLVLVVILLGGCGSKKENPGEVITTEDGLEVVNMDDVIIRVDDVFVTKDLFEKYYGLNLYWYGVDFGLEALDQDFEGQPVREVMKTHVLDQLLEQSLVKRHVLASGFEMDQTLFNEKLAEQNQVIEEDPEMKRAFEDVGIDKAFLEYAVENSMIQVAFQSLVKEAIEADTARLNLLYEQYAVQVSARHILVESEALALEIKEKLEAGEAFEDLAKTYSNDVGTSDKGGTLGFFARGVMDPAFETTAFSIPVGTISEPVETQLGYHIIEVIEKKTVNQMVENGDDEVLINRYKDEVIGSVFHEYAQKIILDTRNNALVEVFYEKLASDKE